MSMPAGARAGLLAGTISLPRTADTGTRIVITGKGGVGKTTLTAILAHIFARQGRRVVAVDGDPQQNLAATLGVLPDAEARIVPVSKSVDYLREKTGASPDLSPGGLLTLNPDVSDVIDRFAVPVVTNLRLLVMGCVQQAGSGCLCPEYTLLAAIFRHMRLLPDDVVLLDTPAGLEHFGRAVAEGFSCAVVVTDSSYNALSVARESAALARQLGIRHVILVVNRVAREADEQKVRADVHGVFEPQDIMILPFDQELASTEPSVVPLLHHESEFIRKVEALSVLITGR